MTWAADMQRYAEDFREEYKEAIREEHDQPWEGDRALWSEWDGRHWTGDIETRITDLFTDFSSGDLATAEQVHHDLTTAADKIDENVNELLDGLEKRLEAWSGDAATNFAEFMGQLKDRVAINLKGCIEAAGMALDGYVTVLRERDKNVLDLVSTTQQSLATAEAEEEAREERIKLSILDSLTTVSMPASPLDAILDVSNRLKSGYINVKILSLGGVKRSEVIASMVDNGERIVAECHEASRRVQQALHDVTQHMTHDNLDQVRVGRPTIVTDEKFDPNEFRHSDQTEDTDRTVRKGGLVAEPPKDQDQQRDYTVPPPDVTLNPFPHDAYREQ